MRPPLLPFANRSSRPAILNEPDGQQTPSHDLAEVSLVIQAGFAEFLADFIGSMAFGLQLSIPRMPPICTRTNVL
jgi:hypothetical protein